MECLSSPLVPDFLVPCTNNLGADGAYTLNKKPLSQRCTTLDEVIQHLANSASAASPQHPDIRVQPTGDPIHPPTVASLQDSPPTLPGGLPIYSHRGYKNISGSELQDTQQESAA